MPTVKAAVGWAIVEHKSSPTPQKAELDARITAAIAKGRKVLVPAGYYATKPLAPMTGNLEVVGAGEQLTTIGLDSGSNSDLFRVAKTVTAFHLRDLDLDLQG